MSDTKPPADIPPCIFCEKRAKLHQPVILTTFYMHSPAGLINGSAPVHLSCFIDAMAGRTARVVLDALQKGEVEVGLMEEEDGDTLDDTVTKVVAAVVERYTR